jgi:hypothetical protein
MTGLRRGSTRKKIALEAGLIKTLQECKIPGFEARLFSKVGFNQRSTIFKARFILDRTNEEFD